MRHSALLACRSPPLLSRRRPLVRPLPVGSGATPAMCRLPKLKTAFRPDWTRGLENASPYDSDDTPTRGAEGEFASPLAEDPYSLRHTALSTWLNNGVPLAEVAKRAGHTIEMLFRTYAKCVVGQEDLANKRIEEALGESDPDL